jgi:hypothetical protein
MTIRDTYANRTAGHDQPASNAFAITPDNDAPDDWPAIPRGIILGGGDGSLRVRMAGGDVVTFTGLALGVIHPLRVRQVYATGTGSTDIVGVY